MRKNVPGHVGVNHEDHVGLSDEGVRGLTECDSGVHDVVEGEVDSREAGGEDGDGEEVDELDELGDGSEVATEVGGDDEGVLGCGDASGLYAAARKQNRKPLIRLAQIRSTAAEGS